MATAALVIPQPRAPFHGVLDFLAYYLGGGYFLADQAELDDQAAWAFVAMTAARGF